MRDDRKIQLRQVHALCRGIVCEDFGIIAGIEQDALAAIFDKAENPQSFFIVEVWPKAS
jgi:hypothetical protein